jgi:hypothetical protein
MNEIEKNELALFITDYLKGNTPTFELIKKCIDTWVNQTQTETNQTTCFEIIALYDKGFGPE